MNTDKFNYCNSGIVDKSQTLLILSCYDNLFLYEKPYEYLKFLSLFHQKNNIGICLNFCIHSQDMENVRNFEKQNNYNLGFNLQDSKWFEFINTLQLLPNQYYGFTPFDDHSLSFIDNKSLLFLKLSHYSIGDWNLIEKFIKFKKPVLISVPYNKIVSPLSSFFKNRNISHAFITHHFTPNKEFFAKFSNLPSDRLNFFKSNIDILNIYNCIESNNLKYYGTIKPIEFICNSNFFKGSSVKFTEIFKLLASDILNFLELEEDSNIDSDRFYADNNITLSSLRCAKAKRNLEPGQLISSNDYSLVLRQTESQIDSSTFSKYNFIYASKHINEGDSIDFDKVKIVNLNDSFKDFTFNDLLFNIKQSGRLQYLETKKPVDGLSRIIIFLHGGGFVTGSPNHCKPLLSYLSMNLNCMVFAPYYSLAPAHPFPTALNEIKDFYIQSVKDYPDYEIYFFGESAGGGLAVSVSMLLRDQGYSLPSGIILVSPWVDLTMSSHSHNDEMNEKDIFLLSSELKLNVKSYVGDHNPSDPLISPLFGNFLNFPPCFLIVGSNEILLDDTRRLYSHLKRDNVFALLRVWDNMPHVFTSFYDILEPSRDALQEVVTFVTQVSHLSNEVNL